MGAREARRIAGTSIPLLLKPPHSEYRCRTENGDERRETDRRRATVPRSAPFLGGHHDRDQRQHRQLAEAHDIVFGGEARVPVFEERHEQYSEDQAGAGAAGGDENSIRAVRTLRDACRIEYLELLADVAAFQIRRQLGLLALRQQTLI